MRVLAVLPPEPWIENHILSTLRRHYCDALHVMHYPGGLGILGSKEWRRKRDGLNNEVLEAARNLRASGRLDAMFFMVYDDFLRVDTAKRLRDLRVPMINYHVDMAFQWYRVIRTAPYFDMLAVAQRTNAEHLAPYNPTIEWMPMAANPDACQPSPGRASRHQHDVSFVGSFNPYRRAIMAHCVKQGFKPAIYGQGWHSQDPSPYRFDWDLYKICHDLRYYGLPRWRAEGARYIVAALKRKVSRQHVFEDLQGAALHPPCSNEDMPNIFRSSEVNLGFSDTGWHCKDRVVPSKNLQCRLRDFEVPMSKGFYLVQKTPDHEEYYKLGVEIETWSEPEELVEKLSFYSNRIAAAERIREAGHERARRSHTWRHRFDKLFQRLKERGHLS